MSSVLAHMSGLVAEELNLPKASVEATVALLADGAVVPFIARYRKERTGCLDEEQIRLIRDRVSSLQRLSERQQSMIRKLQSQGKLTAELERALLECRSLREVDDLCLPYRTKKRTRASLARERGLEGLALVIGQQPLEGDPLEAAVPFVQPDRQVPNTEAALAGARDILAEAVAERADVRQKLRDRLRQADLVVKAADGQDLSKTKYRDFQDYREDLTQLRPYRYLAACRGESEKKLVLHFDLAIGEVEEEMAGVVGLRPESPMADQLLAAVRDSLTRLVLPAVERDIRAELREQAEATAIAVFASNLRDLLLAPALGPQPVLGVDPGLRTGCKIVAVDGHGALLDTESCVLTTQPTSEENGNELIGKLAEQAQAVAVAVGTGTGGREAFAALRTIFDPGGTVSVVPVSDAGASAYSASRYAKKELPEVDVTVRAAVSIARRLQDPLAELVKIDPRSIGVGQYQHDVDQKNLRDRLEDVVESCVNAVGVDLNLASPALLRSAGGLGPKLAHRIIEHRSAHGPFVRRSQLLDVPGMDRKSFHQAVGFLRIREGESPLDNTAIHPDHFDLVEQMAHDVGASLGDLVGNGSLVASLDLQRYVSDKVTLATVQDIAAELSEPGRDPRQPFVFPVWRADVRRMQDLEVDMEIEGVVTNVTEFGAFVDIGVSQDGLVHISQLAQRFVSDPREVVRVGQRLTVRVLEVDLERGRISLTGKPKSTREGQPRGGDRDKRASPRHGKGPRGARRDAPKTSQRQTPPANKGFGYTPFADLAARLKK